MSIFLLGIVGPCLNRDALPLAGDLRPSVPAPVTSASAQERREPRTSLSDDGRPETEHIDQIRAGDRVLARNPELGEAERSAATEAADNRWEDGTVDPIEVDTLQPPEWIETHGARVGALVPLPLDPVQIGVAEYL